MSFTPSVEKTASSDCFHKGFITSRLRYEFDVWEEYHGLENVMIDY